MEQHSLLWGCYDSVLWSVMEYYYGVLLWSIIMVVLSWGIIMGYYDGVLHCRSSLLEIWSCVLSMHHQISGQTIMIEIIIDHHSSSSNIIGHHRTSYLIVHHRPSSNIIHHRTSSIIIHHRRSSVIIRYHLSSIIDHHRSMTDRRLAHR